MQVLPDHLLTSILGLLPTSKAKIALQATCSTWSRLLKTPCAHRDDLDYGLAILPPEGAFYAYIHCMSLKCRLAPQHDDVTLEIWTPCTLCDGELDRYIETAVRECIEIVLQPRHADT